MIGSVWFLIYASGCVSISKRMEGPTPSFRDFSPSIAASWTYDIFWS